MSSMNDQSSASGNWRGMCEQCDLILHNGVLVTVDARDRVIDRGAIAIRGGRIVDLGDDQEMLNRHAAPRLIDLRGAIVHPGFIDAHIHISQYTSRSVLPLMEAKAITMGEWKAELRAEDEYASTRLAGLALLKSGHTGFVDPGTVFEPDAAAAAAKELGIRGWLTDPYVADRPQALTEFLPSLASERFLRRWPRDLDEAVQRIGGQLWRNEQQNALVKGYIGLYGEGTDSMELFRAGVEMARRWKAPFQEHLGYLPRGLRTREALLGKPLLRHLAELDLLDPCITFIHMNAVHQSDVEILADHNIKVVWCPYGQLAMLGHGDAEPRMAELVRRGVRVGIGSDIPRNFSFEALAGLALAAAAAGGNPVTAREVLRMRSIEAAATIGAAGELGSLEPDKRADIVVRRVPCAEAFAFDRALELAVMGPGEVDLVLVDGQPVVADGRAVAVDEPRVIEEAHRSAHQIAERIGLQ